MRLKRWQKVAVAIVAWIGLVVVISLTPIPPYIAPIVATVISLLIPRISDKILDIIFGKEEKSPEEKKKELDEWEVNAFGSGNVSFQDSKIILSIQQKGTSYAMAYRKEYHSLLGSKVVVRAQVTPMTLYRFALGVWTSPKPNDPFNKLVTLELDDDAFRLAYTTHFWNEWNHRHIESGFRPRAGETYTVELEIWKAQQSDDLSVVAFGRIYRKDVRQGEARSILKDPGLPYSSNIFVGVAVWTDRPSDPLSKYKVEKFEIG